MDLRNLARDLRLAPEMSIRVHALAISSLEAATTARKTVRLHNDQPVKVGRDPAQCDLVLGDRRVSSVHALIEVRGGGLRVRDLGSRNGTWRRTGLEEQRLEADQPIAVAASEQLRIGPFLITPCECAGGGVYLSADVALGIPTDPHVPEIGESGETAESHRARGFESFVRSVRDVGRDDVWSRVLWGVAELLHADRGYLVAVGDDRILCRAELSGGDPPLVSRTLIQHTYERGTTWALAPDELPAPEAIESLQVSPEARLIAGVSFRAASGEVVAVALLESAMGASPGALEAVEAFADAAGLVVERELALERASRARASWEELAASRSGSPTMSVTSGEGFVGDSPAFEELLGNTRRAAGTSATILLHGPSGSGKTEIARLVHEWSARRDGPFVVMNCGAIPDSLFESHFFGHERGAFTSADKRKEGAFERADGGTLFLDEVSELTPSGQASLLRTIESGLVMRLGATVETRVSVRIIAATNRDLAELVEQRAFRQDLYFRLNVLPISVPPLRERREDIVPLAEHFLRRHRRPDGGSVTEIDLRAQRLLEEHAWQGNVRELANVVQRAVVHDRDGVLGLDDLPSEILGIEAGDSATASTLSEATLEQAVLDFEKMFLRRALAMNEWKMIKTAEMVGVSRKTLYNKIQRYGITRPS